MKKTLRVLVVLTVILAAVLPLHLPVIAGSSDNPPPQVIPAVQEWDGGVGRFTPSESTRICTGAVGSAVSESDRAAISELFRDVMGRDAVFTNEPPSSGDIYFLMSNDNTLPKNGYELDASSILKIAARESIGFYYGMVTFLQCVAAEGSFPVGIARDYPQYGIRSGMIDVARIYIPLEYVEVITKYFAFFKMNEIHLHINDNGTGFSAFRLESDVDGLTSEDGYYTKAEYRAFQKRMAKFHIDVITEISVPAHAGCFANVVPDLMLDSSHLDITKNETLKFVENLLDEYIQGSDPVFPSRKVHIGCDDYPAGYDSEMLSFTNQLAEHCLSRKTTPRFWGTIGGEGFNANTKVTSKAECNYWAVNLSDPAELMDRGFTIVNSCAPVLYCVPGGNSGFPDYPDIETLYSSWFVHYLGTGESSAVPSNHKQLGGASFALWNDLSYLRGYSCQDIFDRLRYMVALVAEKTWTGDRTAEHTSKDFMTRFSSVSAVNGPGFPSHTPRTLLDEDSIQQYEWIGFPCCVAADVLWDGSGGSSVILQGKYSELRIGTDGELCFLKHYDFRSDGDGSSGERQFDGIEFGFDYRMTANKKTHLAFYVTAEGTVLVVDGVYAFEPKPLHPNGYAQSTTFCPPLQFVGSDAVRVEELSVRPYPEDFESQRADGNLAYKKEVTVNGIDPDVPDAEPAYAVDGRVETAVSFGTGTEEPWIRIDLGSVHSIGKIVLRFQKHISSYRVSVSEDGVTFADIYEALEGDAGVPKDDTLKLEPIKARFIRLTQTNLPKEETADDEVPAVISEIEIYGLDTAYFEDLIADASAFPDDEELSVAAEELGVALKKSRIYTFEIDTLADRIQNRILILEHEQETARKEAEAEESRKAEESRRAEESRKAAEADSSDAEEREPGSGPLAWILLAVCVASVAAVVYLLVVRSRGTQKK